MDETDVEALRRELEHYRREVLSLGRKLRGTEHRIQEATNIAAEMTERGDALSSLLRGMARRVGQMRREHSQALENPVSDTDTPDGDTVDRVAAAMWSGPPEWGSPILESLGYAQQYRQMARAAIAAMQGGAA